VALALVQKDSHLIRPQMAARLLVELLVFAL
jgi:hypothetical protein